MNLWILAIVGAFVTFVGDVLCVQAARGSSVWLVAISCVFFACGGPIWYYMSKVSNGSLVIPALTWNVVAMLLSFASIMALERHQTPRQWVGLVIVFVGMFIRG